MWGVCTLTAKCPDSLHDRLMANVHNCVHPPIPIWYFHDTQSEVWECMGLENLEVSWNTMSNRLDAAGFCCWIWYPQMAMKAKLRLPSHWNSVRFMRLEAHRTRWLKAPMPKWSFSPQTNKTYHPWESIAIDVMKLLHKSFNPHFTIRSINIFQCMYLIQWNMSIYSLSSNMITITHQMTVAINPLGTPEPDSSDNSASRRQFGPGTKNLAKVPFCGKTMRTS